MVGTGHRTPANKTSIGGMCADHQQAFFKVARALNVWILVRATNKSSLQYMGSAYPNIIPKPKNCDAKTADEGPNAGLVVCPLVDPGAFSAQRLDEALTTWDKWAPEWKPLQLEKNFLNKSDNSQHRFDFDDGSFNKDGLPIHYGVIEDDFSPFHACVVNFQSGSPKMMHGDYDLYDVVDPANPNDRRRVELDFNGGKSMAGVKTELVMETLNSIMSDGQVSNALIQHGEHLAKFTHKEDMIYAFSPYPGDGLIVIYPFAFGLKSIKSLYQDIFNNRQPLGR